MPDKEAKEQYIYQYYFIKSNSTITVRVQQSQGTIPVMRVGKKIKTKKIMIIKKIKILSKLSKQR